MYLLPRSPSLKRHPFLLHDKQLTRTSQFETNALNDLKTTLKPQGSNVHVLLTLEEKHSLHITLLLALFRILKS